ncbi:lytic murein transglycosylase [Acetonema longum DSM 6540]|uniref:Lytic murein transglycosylase n=2 Tax=Acetonema TaxID=2373 RepID=F7NL45_9FIRM|nr:lytic murein transglycosylase [Acetonema longum DSM 6540]
MKMNGIARVMARISDIEKRFQPIPQRNAKHTANLSGQSTTAQPTSRSVSGTAESSFADYLSTAQRQQAPVRFRQSAVSQTENDSRFQAQHRNQVQRMVHATAEKYGVDPKLAVAVAKVESDFSANAVSSAGAVGVMQLMPETARKLNVRNIRDPKENIDGGVRYLKEMLDTFNGDVRKAVAAYNAGPEAVKSYQDVPPYPETKNYVAKVMSFYR